MNEDRIKFLIDYVRKSVALAEPSVEKDTAYIFSDEDIFNIISMSIPQHNPNYTLENFPDNELSMLAILSRVEIFWRLATSSAKFYPISAEGADLKKNYRFTHYYKLIQLASLEYKEAKANFMASNVNTIKLGNTLVDTRHFNHKQRNLQDIPKVGVRVIETTSNSIGIEWDKFKSIGGLFGSYIIYCNTSPVYDEFEYKILTEEVARITDINRLRLRIKNLKPNTKYYLAVVARDINLLEGVTTLSVNTKPEEGVEDATSRNR